MSSADITHVNLATIPSMLHALSLTGIANLSYFSLDSTALATAGFALFYNLEAFALSHFAVADLAGICSKSPFTIALSHCGVVVDTFATYTCNRALLRNYSLAHCQDVMLSQTGGDVKYSLSHIGHLKLQGCFADSDLKLSLINRTDIFNLRLFNSCITINNTLDDIRGCMADVNIARQTQSSRVAISNCHVVNLTINPCEDCEFVITRCVSVFISFVTTGNQHNFSRLNIKIADCDKLCFLGDTVPTSVLNDPETAARWFPLVQYFEKTYQDSTPSSALGNTANAGANPNSDDIANAAANPDYANLFPDSRCRIARINNFQAADNIVQGLHIERR